MGTSLTDIIGAEISAMRAYVNSLFVHKSGDTMTGVLSFTIGTGGTGITFTSNGNIGTGGNRLWFGQSGSTSYLAIDNLVFFPVQAPTASAPAYVKGGLYFDTTANKLKVGGATAWETVTSA